MPLGRLVLSGDPLVAAGQRDKYVTIQKRPTADATGDEGFPIENWSTLRREWMARRDVRADERFVSAQQSSSAETIWYLPFADDMDPEVLDVPKLRRLSYRGKYYDITTATRIDRGWIELQTLASTRVGA